VARGGDIASSDGDGVNPTFAPRQALSIDIRTGGVGLYVYTQIRLHCAWAGIPLVGDVRYGGAAEWAGQQCDHHHLHAHSLSFTHPVLGTPMKVCARVWAYV